MTPLLLGGLTILTWVANYCGGALQEPGVGVNTHLQLLKYYPPPMYVLEHLITGPNGKNKRKPI